MKAKTNTIKVALAGASGYAGSEVLRLLTGHSAVEITALGARSAAGKTPESLYGHLRGQSLPVFSGAGLKELARGADVLFLALPHGVASHQIDHSLLEQCRVIDLGADFRLKERSVYEGWYNTVHGNEALLKEAVYGLCEIHRNRISGARLVANPGCYTTCSILTLYPLVQAGLIRHESLIIDAKSGISGAGRSLKQQTLFCESHGSLKAYGVASHRHTPEIEQELSLAAKKSLKLNFTPHLIPVERGILVTAYADLNPDVSASDIDNAYRELYGDEFFVRYLGENVLPETRWVKGSNFTDIGFVLDERTRRVIVCGALDNLMKGAASQAIQNMNLLFGLNEKTGLPETGFFP